jgi:hypothetical protein
MDLRVDWYATAKIQGFARGDDTPTSFPLNPFAVARFVDPLLVCKSLEKKFKIISRLQKKYLAIPAANSFQERVFSMATYIDSVHRQLTNPSTFETNTLLKANSDFVEKYVDKMTFNEKLTEMFVKSLSSGEPGSMAHVADVAKTMMKATKESDVQVIELN